MGFALAGLASLAFVALDVLRKILGGRFPAAQIVIGINLGAGAIFTILQLLSGHWSADWIFVVISSLEILTFTVASVLYVQAVSLSPLSLTIPYLAFTPVVSAFVATVVLEEYPQPAGWLGIGLVVAGALLLHLDQSSDLKKLLSAPIREPGSWRMLVVAVIWGLTTSLDKVAIIHGSELLLGMVITLGSSALLGFLLFLGVRFEASDERKAASAGDPLLVLAGLVAAVAVLAQFFAYREVLVAYVETLKRAGGLGSVLIGIIFFAEGGFSSRIPAATLMILGIVLILL